MEVAIIDWKSIDSKFVKDELLERINAPQWVDLSSPDDDHVDDDAWFCRPDCNHPKTAEDFLNRTPTSASKIWRSANVSEILPLGVQNQRDAALKKRGSKHDRFNEDSENYNPNFSTPPNEKAKFIKQTIKSSEDKKQQNNSLLSRKEEEAPRLKSTLSARNLFSGRDILSQVTEFCNELKRLAMRTKEKESGGIENANANKGSGMMNKWSNDMSGDKDESQKERKPLLEASKDKCKLTEKGNLKEKQRRKIRTDEAENHPISLDLKNVKGKGHENTSQIRTCPPSPQCFSAGHGLNKTQSKASRHKPPERGILQELNLSSNKETRKEGPVDKPSEGGNMPIVAEREARTLDVLWFLKPCTLSS